MTGGPAVSYFVPAYRRPDLLQGFLEHWRAIEPRRRLLVAVDGPADNATERDRVRREQVIRVAKRFSAEHDWVDLAVRSRNTFGVSFLRAAEDLPGDAIVMLEEDNRISAEGLAFLEHAVTGYDSPRHAAAYTSETHGGVRPTEDRMTLFSQQWGVAVNRAHLEVFRHVVREPRIRRQVLNRAFRPILGSGSATEDRIDEWLHRIRGGATNRQEDALLQYSTWLAGGLTVAPWESHVEDVGHLEDGGYSQRPEGGVLRRDAHAPDVRRTDAGLICLTCERSGSRPKPPKPGGLDRVRRRLRAEAIWRIQRHNFLRSRPADLFR